MPWVNDVEQDLPMLLSDLGIYEDLLTREPTSGTFTYQPQWQLYSNDSTKQRLLYLPADTHIEASSTSWSFPVGTTITKTFTYDDVAGHNGPFSIETRVIFRRSRGWEYALYRWNETGTEAVLTNENNWPEEHIFVPRVSDPQFPYVVPGQLDCRTCHETSQEVTGSPVLGIGPYQTDSDLAGAFSSTPVTQEVEGRTPAETAALGYFIGNCSSCHNGGRATNSAFSLYPEEAIEQTVNRPTEGETIDGIRVVPRDPDASAIFIAVTAAHTPEYRGSIKPMPPLSITRPDAAAESILRQWIEGL